MGRFPLLVVVGPVRGRSGALSIGSALVVWGGVRKRRYALVHQPRTQDQLTE
jgi:hypothetical protein